MAIEIVKRGSSGGGTVTSSGAGLTVPQTIQGYALDIDPALGVTKDGSNNVSAIVDQGPYGFTFSQSTQANQPLYVANGVNSTLPILRFYGNPSALDADLTNPALTVDSTKGWVIYLVFKHNGFTGANNYQCPLFLPNGLGTIDRSWILISNDATYLDVSFGSGSTYVLSRSSSMGLTTTGFHVLRLKYSGVDRTSLASFNYRLDSTTGTTATNAGYGSTVTTGALRIGARGDSNFPLNADIARILTFTQDISAANDAKLMTYLRSTYGTP